MGFLTATVVKNFEFHKSNMADGGHFENRYIILSLQPFDWFWLNLAMWYMLGLRLPDLPYFTGDPVFQTLSPASQWEAAGKNKSPVFC